MNRRQFLTGLAGLVAPAQAKEAELEYKDVLRILADYSLVHKSRLMDEQGRGLHGRTNGLERTIEIADQDKSFKIFTIIHEMLHIRYREMGLIFGEHDEAKINEAAIKLYTKLYGDK